MSKDMEENKEPSREVSHWIDEISAAKKREKDFRKEGEEVIEIYSGKKCDQIPFNILFSNVETLLPALFSQVPRPVVKRRFNDNDPIGMAASKAGERMLKYLLDTNVEGYETFEESMSNATLDALLPGRGITAIKYDAEVTDVPSSEEDEEPTPVVQWEQVCTDSRSWNRVYFGYAKKWSKVPWIAYEEYLDEEECERMFGEEVAAEIEYSEGEDDEDEESKSKSDENKGSRKTAVVYQIWDKVGDKKIRYISPAYKKGYLKIDDDYLKITGFYNCPRPIQFVKKSNDLMPVAMYKLYENQARELNTLTTRIQKITKAIKARGAYDGSLGDELSKIMDGDDNELIPTDKGSSLIDGGLSKAIWFMPIEQLIVVLQQLINAREACKRTIYEITGISDILRGQSMASETLGAQQIKESWGTLRLKRLQQEVQRYARDTLRIMLEVAASKLSEKTWAQATGLPFPTADQKAKAQQVLQAIQMQAQQMQMQQMGQPPQPPQQPDPKIVQAAQSPSWEEIIGVLKDDMLRSYKIDIETNSTIDVEATEDQKNVADFMNAMGQLMAGLTPMVEAQAMPFEAAQSIMLAVVRKYRFGTEVEEQFANMKAPNKVNPEADKAKQEAGIAQQEAQVKMQEMQQQAQLVQQQMQADMNAQMMQLKSDQQIEMAKLQAKAESEMAMLQLKAETDAQKLQMQKSIDQMKADIQRDTALKTASLQGAVQIEIAKINACAQAQTAVQSAMVDSESKAMESEKSANAENMMAMVLETQGKLLETLSNKPPVAIERDNLGRATMLVPKVQNG